ncbi:P-type conjugative transfer protein TrbL, partial [Vibrio anguillarum]|nr:P-type conjugative transfer protein TrbL [Vibrio anguillarum]
MKVRQVISLGLIIPSATAHAAIDNNGVLDDVAFQFMTVA